MNKVSVIIPTYNRANTIKRAINSVLQQTFKNFEIIIIDDGSQDNTEEVIQNLNNSYIIYKKIPHSGVSRARNEGITISNGDLIAFLDSDDKWVNTKLQKQVQYLNNNTQFPACHTNEIWIKNGIRINQGKKHKKYAGNFFIPSLKLCLISPSSVIIKKEIFDQIGKFDENFNYVEDYELWLRLTSRYKVGYIDEKLVIKYGGHSDQLSRKIDGIEKYRMLALEKFIINNYKDNSMRFYIFEAFNEYSKKFKIFTLGCLKRGKKEELEEFSRKFRKLKSLINKHSIQHKRLLKEEFQLVKTN